MKRTTDRARAQKPGERRRIDESGSREKEYRPAMSENYSNDMNNSNDNCFGAFDLDDFMADFVPPEMSNVLKESDAQRKDRLRRNREAAQLSRSEEEKAVGGVCKRG